MTIQTRRYNGLASLLENAETLAAIRSYYHSQEKTNTFPTRDLTYLESCAECANDNLTGLLETFARVAEDWQQLQPYQQNTPANDVARALSTLSILAGNVLAELATIREHIAWAKESGVAP